MGELIKAKDVNLADLLREGCFIVPRHQRHYDWEIGQVDDLLEDLYESVTQNKPCYFLGSIMLIKTGKLSHLEINDGQQRIITFSMICAYFCRVFHERGDTGWTNNCLRVLFDIPEGHGETLEYAEHLSPRVIPPRNDRINFGKLICGHDIGRNGKMTSAWNHIRSFFAGKKNLTFDRQKEILEFMLNRIIVIRLEVDNSLDTHAIYEALNSRGKDLDDVDLIKNYFLSFFANDENPTRYDSTHEKFEDKIYTAIPAHAISDYVRCCMQVQYGFIKKEQFFRETRKIFGSPKKENSNQVYRFVDGLAANSSMQIFKTLLQKTESHEFMQKLTSDARKGKNIRKIDSYLLDLHDYKITRPILFALFFCYVRSSDSNRKRTASFVYGCAKLLSSFVQRIAHVDTFKPSLYEEHFAVLAKDINDKKCNSIEMFFNRLKLMDKLGITDDRQYFDLMDSKFMGKNSIRKSGYILRRIVGWQDRSRVIAESEISVEHILPNSTEHYTKKAAWAAHFSQSDRERLVHCLGNLTLLSKQQNSPTAKDNESFSAKKRIYSGSSIQITKEICEYGEWTPKNVKGRQRKLAKIAAKQIWNFDF